MVEVSVEGHGARRVGNVWCIGRNYAEHASELGNVVPSEPIVFLKPTTALRGLEPSPVAFPSETFDHECELVLLLGRDVPLGGQAGWEAVEAVGVGIDLTRREVQSRCKARGLPWWPAKGFAGSGVVSPLVPVVALEGAEDLQFGLDVEGVPRQHGAVRDMVHPIPALLEHLARHVRLAVGDLIFTGTPAGVGPLRVGQRFGLWLQDGHGQRTFHGEL